MKKKKYNSQDQEEKEEKEKIYEKKIKMKSIRVTERRSIFQKEFKF